MIVLNIQMQHFKLGSPPCSWSDIAEVVDDTGLGKPQKITDFSNWERILIPIQSLEVGKCHLVIKQHVRNVVASISVPHLKNL